MTPMVPALVRIRTLCKDDHRFGVVVRNRSPQQFAPTVLRSLLSSLTSTSVVDNKNFSIAEGTSPRAVVYRSRIYFFWNSSHKAGISYAALDGREWSHRCRDQGAGRRSTSDHHGSARRRRKHRRQPQRLVGERSSRQELSKTVRAPRREPFQLDWPHPIDSIVRRR
ncbi:uncharacterized protein PSFLO_05113 [Pseudozyma flocculosa]|uniref:Uncharacterized protein n=1 Tax=Pseudozyma flocculosa TaxID=84751 RepID=A0A5C3F5I5_9BASI|nr:uncharacterized protein PSFLO_05113 [Pseudozyma flocculosa]